LRERERPPDGGKLRYELKLDGFRAIGLKSDRSAQLWSRIQRDFTPLLSAVLRAMRMRRCY
jgi:ATP-dependent DNA ligase